MVNITVKQALNFCMSMDDAFYNHNSYGGDTAEVYAYSLMPNEPLYANCVRNDTIPESDILRDAFMEVVHDCAEALYELLTYYAKIRECRITVDERPLGPWLKKEWQLHRWHIKVVRKKDR